MEATRVVLSRVVGAAVGLLAAAAPLSPAGADPVADFYRGKVIYLNIGFSAGGGFDLYARTVARHMIRHIPGNPNIIPQQMPGAGSVRAAMFMHSRAPQDGTQIATFGQSIPLQQAMGDHFKVDNSVPFNWIGNPIKSISTVAVWHASGVRTIEDAKRKEITIGATGNNVTAYYPLALNSIVGTKFKVIQGYPGGADIELAMERGEVDGKGQFTWATLKSTRRDWLAGKKVNLLTQIGFEKDPEISQAMGYDVPLMPDLAPNEEGRQILELLSSGEMVGRPLLTTPNVPMERVTALRRAFDATMRDPIFLEDATKLGLDIDPLAGEQLQEVVQRVVTTPRAAVEKLMAAIRMGGSDGKAGPE
jgi:tripartite-type tricarboxylate transporter receptor subunit TctC